MGAISPELSVVAEGVENNTVLASLKEMGCDQAQGYHFNRPLPEPDFSVWLREREPMQSESR